ncbi:lytic transglycosylase domain-containing protein [Crossiella sp. SN42]|uniref:lytic transglycosylase domain-containing protein n=1 Tax=Crossiella sp. SN42 TaxID=2944808 RepID=UPI00207C5FE1|nr:lytic transglycosylase domain-containing protein [Crossiella sp. SN42]MCO1574161.1 lytic transglycosylase domain-containing protein [Crossiella sp. SN42]
MAVLEPADEFGLWRRVKPFTEWPDTNEDTVGELAEGWKGAQTALDTTVTEIRTAGARSLAAWRDDGGQKYAAKLTGTQKIEGLGSGMARMAGHAEHFGEVVRTSKQSMVDMIETYAPYYGLMSAFPGAAAAGMQLLFAGMIANNMNGMLDRNAALLAAQRMDGTAPISPELQDIRNLAGHLPGGNVTIPLFGTTEDSYREAWIRDNRNVILAAASKYGLPPDLVAGIAWQEVAGKPGWVDDLALNFRRNHEARSQSTPVFGQPPIDQNGDRGSNATSFGPMSIQIRRAAETLGYDLATLTNAQEDQIVSSLKDTKQNIFIAASHLADLRREAGFGEHLTPDNYREIAARYNGGPYWQGTGAQKYGDIFVNNLPKAQRALYDR